MLSYLDLENDLLQHQFRWLVTGAAGFIGSNLVERLLKLNQIVIGVDDFSTGDQKNLCDVRMTVGDDRWKNFHFSSGSVTDQLFISKVFEEKIDYVLHQAALGSVPRSIADPIASHMVNVDGFINVLNAARMAGVGSFVYASSSSVYGDHPGLPKVEDLVGKPLSPYAATKCINESYAQVFFDSYAFGSAGLRYFNVFGRRQNPNGAYAAVMPRWINAMLKNEEIVINGDGSTSRDFCYIENVVRANLMNACSQKGAGHRVYNIAVGERTCLNDLFSMLKQALSKMGVVYEKQPRYESFRHGDVMPLMLMLLEQGWISVTHLVIV